MGNKFNLDNINYQDCVTINKKDIIIDFYRNYIDYFKEDIINWLEKNNLIIGDKSKWQIL